jgi:hypothetical protein
MASCVLSLEQALIASRKAHAQLEQVWEAEQAAKEEHRKHHEQRRVAAQTLQRVERGRR